MSDIYGYLFVHFIGESENGEQIYFSLSEDGLHWNDLNNGNPVLISNIGEKGVRDPFIIKDVKGNGYHIIATDLRIASGKGWGWATTKASRNLLHWYSKDLVNWSEPESYELAIEGAGCLWAPEAVYDSKNDDYMIFFASNVQEENESERKQRIYCVHTKDFKTYSPAKKYIERENHVIDTTIIEYNNKYYRFSKNETSKHIDLDCSDELEGEFTPIYSKALDEIFGVEGPEIYPLKEDGTFCLIIDQFAKGEGYLPLITKDLASGDFRVLDKSEFDLGKTLKRHGGIIPLNQSEYEKLKRAF